jgi:transcription elongation factor Elf1
MKRREEDRRRPAAAQPDRPTPGFPCQGCGAKVKMTIEELLYNSSFRCVVCGAVYEKNSQASAAALEMLQEVHVASKQLDEIRRDPLRGR